MLEHFFSPKYLREHLLGIVAVLFIILILFIQEGDTQLRRVLNRGEVRIVMRKNTHTQDEKTDPNQNFERKFAQMFAEYLNVDLRIITVDSVQDVVNALESEDADFAAAGLADEVVRHPPVRYSRPYQIVDEKVVYKSGKHRPKNFEDLTEGRLLVGAETSYSEKLQRLTISYPKLKFETSANEDAFDLMDKVVKGDIDYTIVDSHDLEQYRRFQPELSVAFDFTTQQALAMAFKPFTRYPGLYKLLDKLIAFHIFPQSLTWVQSHLPLDNSLVNKVNGYLKELNKSGELDWLLDVYYGHLKDFDLLDTRTFLRRVKSILPQYIPLFKRASQTDLEWQLLAAIGYQESHWNPNATSPTGVRGLMMLTLNTSRTVNVTNRLDPTQSIEGGALYYRRLYKSLPQEIDEPDRTWITLAAYNIGLSHVLDIRKLIQHNGGNPNVWNEYRQYLSKKSRAGSLGQIHYSYSRGRQAVIYVENIRRYHDLLKWVNDKGTY